MISPSERRQQILDEMSRLDRLQRGYLSQHSFRRERNGRTLSFGPYYTLQHGYGKGRLCRRVAAAEVEAVKADVAAWWRLQRLSDELVEVTEQMTLESREVDESKKNSRRSPRCGIRRPKGS